MKIQFIPFENAPDSYTFNGNQVTAHEDGLQDTFDFSGMQEGDRLNAVVLDVIDLNPLDVIRNAFIQGGELHVALGQRVPLSMLTYVMNSGKRVHIRVGDPTEPPPEGTYTRVVEHRGGDWIESDWMDASVYDPEVQYIKQIGFG